MINKIIHQIILGKIPNNFIAKCMQSWEGLLPYGYELKIWDRDRTMKLIKEKYEFSFEIFLRARNLAEASDIARYLIVHHFGGHYADWDIMLNSPNIFHEFDEKNRSGCLLQDPLNGIISCEYFSAIQNEQFLLEVINDIAATFKRGEQELMFTPQYSGPHRLTNALHRHPLTSQKIVAVKDVFEYDYNEIRLAKEVGKKGIMTHFWTHTWIQK